MLLITPAPPAGSGETVPGSVLSPQVSALPGDDQALTEAEVQREEPGHVRDQGVPVVEHETEGPGGIGAGPEQRGRDEGAVAIGEVANARKVVRP